MQICIYDTETTGEPDWNQPSELPHQPHIVEIAALLVDQDGNELGRMDAIVRPDGWTIPPEAVEIHGIDDSKALAEGIEEREAINQFLYIRESADLHVAHNEAFDARIIRIGLKRYGFSEEMVNAWRARNKFCTMHRSTKICELPLTDVQRAAGRKKGFKTPALEEAFEFFTGRPPEQQHRALADVFSCHAVYRGIIAHEASLACPTPDEQPPAPKPTVEGPSPSVDEDLSYLG